MIQVRFLVLPHWCGDGVGCCARHCKNRPNHKRRRISEFIDESRGVRTVEAPAAARAPGAPSAGPAATAIAAPAAAAKAKTPSPFQRSFTDPFEQLASVQ